MVNLIEVDTVNIHSNFPQENQNQIKPKSGSNLVLLKYNYKAAKSFEDMILWWSSLNGPIAYPGEYQLIFKAKSYSETVKANIAKDPRYPVSDLDVKKQFDFIKSIRDKLDESNKCIIQDTRYKKQETRNKKQEARYKKQVTSNQQPVT